MKGRRSGVAIAARARKAGPMKHRLQARGGASNSRANYLEDADDNFCCTESDSGYVEGVGEMPMTTPTAVSDIIAQLGGPRIFAMAFKSCAYATTPNIAVTFAIAPGLKRAAKMSHVRVTLDPSDTYTVDFIKATPTKTTTVYSVSDIYCDQLKDLVESKTGLYLSL